MRVADLLGVAAITATLAGCGTVQTITPTTYQPPAVTTEHKIVYEKGSTSIRFRSLEIEVQEASNERIRFIVVNDGSGTPEQGSS